MVIYSWSIKSVSEKIVEYIRLFFKVFESVFYTLCSGSKADGLLIRGSDLDIVRTMVKLIVCKCGTKEANKDTKKAVLFINYDSASPGYK